MRLVLWIRAAGAALLFAANAALADNIVIEHVTLIDGIHGPQRDMTVAVEGERIAGVSPSAVARGLKGRHIDGRGRYLIPGLMDVHIHLKGGFDVAGKVDAEPGPPNRAAGVAALASFLYAGVTTVYDAGNRAEHILPLRADERAGKILSPRIFATGNLITYPGSHGDRIAVRISDFEKDKALLDQHIAESAAGHSEADIGGRRLGLEAHDPPDAGRSAREDHAILQPTRNSHDCPRVQ